MAATRRALEHLKDGWWDDAAHVETLCALVIWRDWIDQEADDPGMSWRSRRSLPTMGGSFRQEGGGVTRAWKPGDAAHELDPLDRWTEDVLTQFVVGLHTRLEHWCHRVAEKPIGVVPTFGD